MSHNANRPSKPCPNCGRQDAEHKDDAMKRATHTAAHVGVHQVHGAMSGHPVGAMVVGGLWAAAKVVNALTKTWSCKCGHTYN